jgi:hypothetical protein
MTQQCRQNPHGKTDQVLMAKSIVKYGALPCPFGHTEEYKDGIASPEMNIHHPLWASKGQDRDYLSLAKGTTIVVPFAGTRRYIYCKLNDEPIPVGMSPDVTEFEDMFVYYNPDGTPSHIKENDFKGNCSKFKPYTRKIIILYVEYNYRGDRRSPQQSLCKCPQQFVHYFQSKLKSKVKAIIKPKPVARL